MDKKLKILHLEDLSSDAGLVNHALKRGQFEFEMLVIDTKDEFINALGEFSPDIILSDHSLPSFNSYEALIIMKERGMCIPFILITANVSEQFAVDVLKRGADDYVLKDRLERLPSAIHNALEKYRLEKERQRYLDEIIRNEQYYRALIENIHDAIILINQNAELIYQSPSAEHITGLAFEDTHDKKIFDYIHPDDRHEWQALFQKVKLWPDISVLGQYRIVHRMGHYIWIEGTITNLMYDENVKAFIVNYRDITARKKAEEKTIHTNRLYAFISHINQTIVRAGDEQTVFKEACRIAIKFGKFNGAWIGMIDYENKKIALTEECGIAHEDIKLFTDIYYENNRPLHQVLLTGTYYVCNNIQKDLELDNWKPLGLLRGYNSYIVLPIKKSGRIIGTFNLYASEINFFDPEEIELLREVTRDISFILDVFEKDAQKADAEQKLKDKELQLSLIYNNVTDSIFLVDVEKNNNYKFISVNKAFLNATGMKEEMIIGKFIEEIIPEPSLNFVLDKYLEVIKTKNKITWEETTRYPSGIKTGIVSLTPVFDSIGNCTRLIGSVKDITEKHAAEEILRRSEANLNAIFDNTSEGFILADSEGIVKYFNNKAKRIIQLNIEREIKTGESLLGFIQKSRKEDYEKIISKALRGETIRYDHYYERKNGKTKWFNFTINPVYSKGIIDGVSITSVDITERKQAEQKLQESERFNKGVLASLSSHLAVIDEDGNIIAVNKAWDDFGKANGATSPEHTSAGSNYFDVCKRSIEAGDTVAEQTLQGILSVLEKEKQTFELEYSCNSPEQQRWFILRVMNFGDNVRRVVISHQEITERKKVEEALRESESNLQAIFENTSEGFILTDLQGVIKFFNNKSKEIFFLNSGKEFRIGESIFDFVLESTQQIYKAALPRVVAGEDLQYDLSFERKNGEIKWFSFTINRVCKGSSTDGFSITVKDITQRKETENAIRQSELRYRQIVETAQEGIWMIDENSRTTFVNKKMCEILEYAEEEMMGKENYYFMDDAGKQQAAKIPGRRINDVGENMDIQFITKSGKHIWTNISANPFFDEEGYYKGALGMVSDITEKKNLEKLLDKASRMAMIGSYEIDLVKNSLYWSAITKQIHEVDSNFTPDIETAINFYKVGASRESITYAVQEAIDNGIAFDLQLEIVTAKGNVRWVRAIGSTECINGKCIRLNGSFQDIDTGKKAEREILKLYEDKNAILESIGDGFYAVDKNWNFTYWNKEAEILLGKKRKEVIGKNIWEVYPDAIDTESYIHYHKAADENTVQHYQHFSEELDSWTEISAYPSVNGLSVYFRDISERIKAEKEREKITADLIQRNKDLEHFSYIISHNLRAPVANIIGLSYTLQKDKLEDSLKKIIMAGLSSSVNKLDEVIKDLNNILKVRLAVDEHKNVISFTKLVNDILLSIESMILTENAAIVCNFSEADEILTMKSYLHSIFYNLISNSLKYRRPNIQPVIEIRSQKVNDKIILFFKDNGLGIDLQKRSAEVFGLYKRFHTDHAEGKGIGLYMVKTQVEAIGGKISISSEVNKGTEFKIEF